MPGLFMLIHSPALFLRVAINIATSTVGVSVIASTIAVGVVVSKLPAQSGANPFSQTTIIVQSSSTLAFNRIIQSYEQQHYYNTTATLLDLVDALNKYLGQRFPNQFIKAVISGFSLNPQNITSRRRRRRQIWCCPHNGHSHDDHSHEDCWICTTASTTPKTTQEAASTTSMNVIGWTGDIDPTGSTGTPQPTQSSASTFTITSSAMSYSSEPSTRDSSTSSSVSLTTTQPTTSNSNNNSSCNIATYDNGSNRTSVIYLNGTLYFNTTKDSTIDPNKIKAALALFSPVIALADQCVNKSSSQSTFNSALSTVADPTEVVGGTSFLANANTIPTYLITAANNVSSPTEAPSYNTTVTVAPSTLTSTTTTSTTTTATESTTPLVG
ncbi:unnamed protein product [Adineta steineri]|uniref:Uncharacterized protein n=1 Tax=Adineta steineri TaxID=433720 RepID=A0A816ABE9_9BILA|nr:unnamed protein product [Adineta steineri]CAF1595250.1 unnamed protein product [Adineta steineri]